MHGTSRWCLTVLALTTFTGCSSDTTGPASTPSPSLATATTGNGAPSGSHFNLNIIGVDHAKSPDMSGTGCPFGD